MSFIKKIHVQMDRHVQMYMYMDMDILYHRMVFARLVRASSFRKRELKPRLRLTDHVEPTG